MYNDFLVFKSGIDDITKVESKCFGKRVYNPDISIMIPTYKRMDCLRNAISSAVKQKTDYRYEIVVVDNNPDTSDEDIEDLLIAFNKFNITYYKNNDNIGMFGNWNRCIKLAKSDWIVVLSDDDELCENYITMVLTSSRS